MMRGNSLLSSAPRMSLSALNTLEDQERQVRIWLLGSTEIKGTVFYRIAGRFHASGQTWQVNRRYSEFLVLRDTLVKYFSRTTDTCPGCLNYLHAIKQFDFPKKHLFVSRSQLVVNYRIQALRSFMNLLASWAFSNSPKCPTCGGFAFDIVRNFCLEGAEAMGDSNMSYIRDSFVVSTFTDAGRRSSLSRHNSFIPASSSQTLNAQRDQQHRRSDTQHRNTVTGGGRPTQPYRQHSHGDDYERDGGGGGGSSRGSRSQQPRQPPHRASSSTGSGRTPQQSTAGSAQASSITGSFLFYQDGVEPGHSAAGTQRPSTANGTSANGSQRDGTGAPPPTGSRRGILKNWNDVRQDRAQNNSYLSLGGDSAASLDPSDGGYKAPSSGRGVKKNRNDARSDNDSYFSLGASSGHSRDDEEYARASSKRAQKPSNGQTTREHERQRQQQQYQEQQRDMRNNDRSLNDSYLSLGASSTSGDLEDEYHSHHPSVLPSPSNREATYVHPPPTQKYVGGTSKKPRSPPPSTSSQRQSQRVRSPPPSSQRQSHTQRTRSPPPSTQRKSQRHRSPPPPQYHDADDDDDDGQPRSSRRHRQPQPQPQKQKQKQVQPRKQPPPSVDESFATDSFIDESLRFDGMGPIAVDDVSDSDDDEIDVTGLAIDARAPPRKSTSGQDLWQPWELAKAG